MLLVVVCVVSDCVETTPAKHACDDDAARLLWDESVGLVQLTADETPQILR